MLVLVMNRSTLLLLIAIVVVHVDAQVVNLFSHTHFYDFEVTRLQAAGNEATNMIPASLPGQKYEYLILDDVPCAPKTAAASKPMHKDIVRAFKDSKFEPKPLMYSNSWKTLSFLLSIQFQPKSKIESLASFYGYELKFQSFEDPEPTCIRVLPNYDPMKRPEVFSDKIIKMNIKDPAFVSHRDKNNSFNFGKIALSVLVSCKNSGTRNTNEVCASEGLTLETPSYVGIPSADATVDTSLFQTREYVCDGTLTYQTCILKYRPLIQTGVTGSGTFMIVHQPMPDEVTSLAGFDYLGLDNVLSVTSLGHQKFKNKLDIKLIRIPDDAAILYSNIVTGLNRNADICMREGDKMCYCEPGKCEKNETNSCLLKREDYQTPIKRAAVQLGRSDISSNQCILNPFFRAFNYSQVGLVDEFQGRRLDFPRRPIDELDDDESYLLTYDQARINSILYNREMLPRVCLLSRDFVSSQQHSSLEQGHEMSFDLVFVTKFKTAAQSSLYSSTFSFRLNFYSFELHNCELSESKSTLASNAPMTPIQPTLLLSKTVNLNEAVQLESIKLSANYLIELIPIANSSLCQPGECVDEADQNNKITCRPCNKLIVYIRTNAPFRAKKAKFDLNANDCSIDLKEYQDALLSSYLNKYDLHDFNLSGSSLNNLIEQQQQQTAAAAARRHQVVKLLEINAGVLPANYSIQDLKLPVTAGTCIVKAHPSFYLYLSIFAALCAIFMVCSLLLYNYAKTRTVFVGRVNQRKVLFYVPAKEKVHYERLEELAKSYKKALKSWFKSLRIEIVSDIHNGKYPLKKYDLVIYTCAHASEFELVSSVDLNQEDWMRMLRIGQGPYDDDFNQIHFVKAYKTKCVDVIDEACYLHNQTQLVLYGLALGTKTASYRDSYFNYDLYFNRNGPPKPAPNHHYVPPSSKSESNSKSKMSPLLRMLKEFSATKLVKKIIYQLNKIYLKFLLRRIQAAVVGSLLNAGRVSRQHARHDEVSSDADDDDHAEAESSGHGPQQHS